MIKSIYNGYDSVVSGGIERDKSITSKKRIGEQIKRYHPMFIRCYYPNIHHINPFQGVYKWNTEIKWIKPHSKGLYLNFQEKCLLTVSRKIAKIELINFRSRLEMTSKALLFFSRPGLNARSIYVIKSATNHCIK